MNDAVVLLSGGADSTTLLHLVVKQLHPDSTIHALSMHYGQKHSKELQCARWQAQALAPWVHHEEMDLYYLKRKLAKGSALVRGGADVPDLSALTDAQRKHPPTYVPNRNMMLLSMAVAYAEAQGVRSVYYGAQAQDEYGYWDCTVEFLARMNAVLQLNRATPVTIHAPFVACSKAEVVMMGAKLGVDYAHTWSCYKGTPKPCGTCPTCVERTTAFRTVGLQDPLNPTQEDMTL